METAQEQTDTTQGTLVVEYGVSDAAIAEMRDKYKGLRINSSDDYKGCMAAIAEVRTLRVDVDNKRKELKADALAWGKKVDGEAKRIIALLMEVEEPLKLERSRVDDEKAAEKALIEERKQQRIDELRAMIEHIRSLGNSVYGKSPEEIHAIIDKLGGIEITEEGYQEYAIEANQVFKQALATASDEYQKAVDRERETKRQEKAAEDLEKEAALLAGQRQAEDKERERKEADLKVRQDKIDAEEKRQREAREEIDREKREAIEKAKREEDQRTEALQREKDAEATLLRAEALRPDKEKLLVFADVIDGLTCPRLEDDDADDIAGMALSSLQCVAKKVREQCANL